MAIHPTAIVEDGAALGAGAEIGPFCIVERGAALGEGVRLISHAMIHSGAEIGARTVVHPNAVLGGDPQIRGTDNAGTKLTVGADCVIREGVTLNRGSIKGGGITSVGDRCYLMAYSHVGHDSHIGNDVTFANSVAIAGHVEVGDGVIAGGLSCVQQFGRIGRYAFIGGMTGMNEDLIPYGIAFGDHAQLAGLNLIGLKRRGVPRVNIHAMRAAYRMIFQSDEGSLADRAKHARETWPDAAEVQEVAEFILAEAKRPVCTARARGQSAEDET